MMKNSVKELTEGMQRLCAIANRIVSHDGEVSPIERDLLLEDLRHLYDVALQMGEGKGKARNEKEETREAGRMESLVMPDDEILSSTVMATMAAMGVESEAKGEKPEVKEEKKPEPMVEVQPADNVEDKHETEQSVAEPSADPEPVVAEPVEMPQMEELEANDNGLLFDEVIIEPEPQEVSAEPETPVQAEESVQQEEQVPMEESAQPDEPAQQETPAQPVLQETAKAGVQASLLDYLKNPVVEKPTVRTLGEKLGGVENGKSKDESEVVAGKKVSDLRTVININDKFSFMSELFHNNMKAYNDFILRLNSIDTRDEAQLYVNEVSAQYRWDESSMAVQSFYKVFDKKF